MSILLALLYLALIILAIGLGYYVVVWALGIAGITINPRILQFIGAIIVVLLLIWFVGEIMAGGGVRLPSFR